MAEKIFTSWCPLADPGIGIPMAIHMKYVKCQLALVREQYHEAHQYAEEGFQFMMDAPKALIARDRNVLEMVTTMGRKCLFAMFIAREVSDAL